MTGLEVEEVLRFSLIEVDLVSHLLYSDLVLRSPYGEMEGDIDPRSCCYNFALPT